MGNVGTFNESTFQSQYCYEDSREILHLQYQISASPANITYCNEKSHIAVRNQSRSELKEKSFRLLVDSFSSEGICQLRGKHLHGSHRSSVPCPYCICTQPLACTCLHPLRKNRLCEDARLCLHALRSNTCSGLLMFKQLCWICQRVS